MLDFQRFQYDDSFITTLNVLVVSIGLTNDVVLEDHLPFNHIVLSSTLILVFDYTLISLVFIGYHHLKIYELNILYLYFFIKVAETFLTLAQLNV